MEHVLDSRYKNIKEYGFPEVFLGICNSKKTGTLHLKNWPAEKNIYIKNGKIIFASSNIEEDCLGISLLTKGKITVSQYYESIQILKKTGKQHGTILIEKGYLSKEEVTSAVKKHIEEIILGIFRWGGGYLFFEEAPFSIDESIILESEVSPLIYKGIKNIDSFPQIRNALPLSTVLHPSADSDKTIKKLKITSDEEKVLALLDGKRSILDILKYLRGNDLEILKFLYTLKTIGAAFEEDRHDTSREFLNDVTRPTNSPEILYKKGIELFMNRKFDQSTDIFHMAVDLNPQKAMYHFYLGLSFLNSSKFEEAERALLKAVEIEPFNDDFYTELGILYEKKGLCDKAKKTFEFALRINPHNERARESL
ncbi:MAG: DUF4388 domain-containing protein [Nitrospiraceae bacterium]|nr:DUF4388 domain-containing protein [Nitrospiraceae bacterium]